MDHNHQHHLELYTVKDVAKLLKVSTKTIYTYVSSGYLEGMILANKFRFSERQINDFIEKVGKKIPVSYVKGTKKHYE